LFTRNYSGQGVFGCSHGFGAGKEKATTVLAAADCATSSGSPSIDIRYEADLTNTVPSSGSPAAPTDCLGNALTAVGGFYTVNNRYYLATSSSGRSELHCASNQGSSGQPIVENVVAVKYWFGEATSPAPVPDSRQIVRYVQADASGTDMVTDWTRVFSVRVCLLMRSSEQVRNAEEGALTYLDCDGNPQTNASGDRYARRAYFTTATLRNKMQF
jgi:type IV pilus assembly protein PilW